MDDKTALNYSIHELIVQNPWFSVHPLEWTSRHLEPLRCKFQIIDAPPETETPVHREETVEEVARLATSHRDKYVSFLDLMLNKSCPFKVIHYGLSLQYGRRRLYPVECDIFVPKTAESMKANTAIAPLVGAFLHYDRVTEAREYRFGQDAERDADDPVQRKKDRKFRLCTPKSWYQDPYLVFHMLSLAQWQSFYVESARYPVCLLVCKTDDEDDAHVYHTIIPENIIEQLYAPTSRFEVTWPVVYQTKIPFKPYGTFFDRLTKHLKLGDISQADEADGKTVESKFTLDTAAMA
ncbi:hypothetical protein NW768_007564 [Fusarium equiseti]|uniref:Uncharacterized protein n=1 Tax=Fusarium equiseti TaxID=61235 RepID=A0ABQ8R7U2_FUSEQ|nr:hypothetical protein NW768_007564 [Fusarium equiseti]